MFFPFDLISYLVFRKFKNVRSYIKLNRIFLCAIVIFCNFSCKIIVLHFIKKNAFRICTYITNKNLLSISKSSSNCNRLRV